MSARASSRTRTRTRARARITATTDRRSILASSFIPNPQQAKNSEIVGAYAKLYQLLMAAGHDTWQDYLLDQVTRVTTAGDERG